MGESKRKRISPKRFAEAMVRGASIEEAALRAGYSQTVAKRGKAGVSKACLLEYKIQRDKALAELEQVGTSVSAQQQEAIVRGKLLNNVADGADESTQSLKLLGQDRRVNMFAPENNANIVIIECPKTGIPSLTDPSNFGLPPNSAAKSLPDGSGGGIWDPNFRSPLPVSVPDQG